jgi:hypothetical protein
VKAQFWDMLIIIILPNGEARHPERRQPLGIAYADLLAFRFRFGVRRARCSPIQTLMRD